ncbi:lysophospholipid acyltransferase family protein [Adhaeribacter aquaticus]|uniref:lysophospholipid acyltransferase family protein n=1 Tax=Adhaeribacter aquaticus TaxID=299567 RepID=UPI00040578A5|nr:lysophospholipid acyltransferase family protein [Adhaeribacter aquaticus]
MIKPQLRKRDYPLWFLLQGISSLPFPVLYFFADIVYVLLYYVIGYRKKVVYQNLYNSFPHKKEAEIKAIAKQFYHNLADIIFEILKIGTISKAGLRKRVSYKNPELLRPFLDNGHTIIALGSHACNWEWGLASSSLFYTEGVDGVYKPLNNPFFEEYMRFLRSRMGSTPVKMKELLRHMIRNRQEPRMVCLLSDQIPPKGEIQYWTTFLNQDTAFYVGADKLADSFKYPVIFIAVERVSRGHYMFSFELLQDQGVTKKESEYAITEAYARTLEKWINKYPADYLWSHRRWKHNRPVTI